MRHLRAGITALILLTSLLVGAFCLATAEDTSIDVSDDAVKELFIVLDEHITKTIAPSRGLFIPMADFAELLNIPVHVINAAKTPSEIYPSSSSEKHPLTRASDAFDKIESKNIKDYVHTLAENAEKIATLVDGRRGDVYVAIRFSRFSAAAKSADKFISAYSTMLDKNKDLSLHLIWFSEEEIRGDYADSMIQAAFPDRVTITVLEPGNASAAIAKLLTAQFDASVAYQLPVSPMSSSDSSQTLSIPYTHVHHANALLRLDFDTAATAGFSISSAQIRQPQIAAQAYIATPTDADNASGPALEPVYIDEANRAVWLLLRDAEPGDYTIELTYGDVDKPVPMTVTTYLCGIEPTLELKSMGADAAPSQPLQWNRDDQTLSLYADLAYIPNPEAQLTPTLTLRYAVGPESPATSSERSAATPSDAIPEWQPIPASEASEEEAPASPTDLPPDPAQVTLSLGASGMTAVSGGYCWTFNIPRKQLPALHEGQIMSISADISFVQTGIRYQSNALSVTIANREPVVAADTAYDLYYDIPGQSAQRSVLDLHNYFSDPDGDALSFKLADHQELSDLDTPAFACVVDSQQGALIFTPKGSVPETSYTVPIAVVAMDPFGATAEAQLQINQYSVAGMLSALRMTPVDTDSVKVSQDDQGDFVFQGSIGDNELKYILPQEALSAYTKAMQACHLPPLHELLTVKSDHTGEEALTWTVEPDGSLTLTVPLGSYVKADTLPIRFSASVAGTDDALEQLIAPLVLSIDNSAPYLSNAAPTAEIVGSTALSGWPNQYTAVAFPDLFGSDVQLASLFADAETASDALTYHVTIDGPAAFAGDDITCLSNSKDGPAVYALNASQGFSALQFTAPGTVVITIRAYDRQHESAEQVVYRAKITSKFWTSVMIGSIITVALLVCAIVSLYLYRKSLPAFGNACVWIAYDHARPVQRWEQQAASCLKLISYGKEHVSLLALLIASAQLLPRGIQPEALADVAMIPGKQQTFSVSLGNRAVAAGLRIYCDGHSSGGKTLTAGFGQIIEILSERERVTFCVTQDH